jgi:hypothetical protein
LREGGGGEGKARGDAVIVDTAAGRKGERKKESKSVARLLGGRRERELFIGTQFSTYPLHLRVSASQGRVSAYGSLFWRTEGLFKAKSDE